MFSKRSGFGWLGAVGAVLATGSLALASGPGNVTCETASVVGLGRSTHSNAGAATDLDNDCAEAFGVVWFSFTAPTTGEYMIDTFGTEELGESSGGNADTVLVVLDACGGTELACNDDGSFGFDSIVKLPLAAGQTIKIAVGEFDEDEITFYLNIAQQSFSCESALWNNGEYNGNGAQTSVLGFNDRWDEVGLLTFDDFYLCDGRVHRIETIRGILCTDAVIPKASLLVVRECDGRPSLNAEDIMAYATQVARVEEEFEDNSECLAGRIELRETGLVNADGFRIIEVIATFDRVWLRGGNYWLTFFGTSGTGNPLEQFFFAYAGQNGVVKGKPGVFFDAITNQFTDVDTLCCGCTDFAFSVEGFYCKILHDNAYPVTANDNTAAVGFPGTPSLQNGSRTNDKSRSADDITFGPCMNNQLCYAEAYIWSNCDRIFLELYANECKKPGGEAFGAIEASCVTDTGLRTWEPGTNIELKLLRAEFYDGWPKFRGNINGYNLWVSVFAQGDNRQNARAYLAFGDRCDRRCDITWNAGCFRGPTYATSMWQSAPADYALMVAVAPERIRMDRVITPPVCRADVNQDGGVTVQDLFDFLTSYFAGCP